MSTTMRESCPRETGRSVIRSMESCLKGREEEDLMDKSSRTMG